MWRRHPVELRADLQRFYGICWDDVLNGNFSFAHAAALAVNLPLGSRCLACEDERAGWTNAEILLLAIANSLREDPIDPFTRPDVLVMEKEELVEYLARPRVAIDRREG